MSGTTADRLTALEAESVSLQERLLAMETMPPPPTREEFDALTTRVAALEDKVATLENAVMSVQNLAPSQTLAPALQDTASDLAALDAWLLAQTGIGLEYQLQRMCQQFYGNPLMPPS